MDASALFNSLEVHCAADITDHADNTLRRYTIYLTRGYSRIRSSQELV